MRRRIRPTHAPAFESLEPRTLLATITWDGGGNGTTWEDANNWSTNALPTAADDVVIDVAANPAITLSSGTRSIHSLTLAETLTITGGTLAVAATATVSGALTLNGGTISGGSWDATAGQFQAGASTASTLSGVALNGDLVLPGGANLRVSSGLTLGPAGRVRLTGTSSNSLGFVGSQTLASGVISLENSGGVGFVGCVGTGTLTIGANASVVGGRAVVGQNVFAAGNAGLINQGTILASAAGATLTVNTSGAGSFSSAGTLRATSGATLSILAGTWSSSGTIAADAGATMSLAGTWSSTGALSAADATLNLGGTFSRSSVAGLTRTGGAVNLTGTLTNSGGTLTLNGTTGSWMLNGGTVSGGTLAFTEGSTLLLSTNNASTLSAVTINGDLVLDTGVNLRVAAGLTLATGSRIRFAGEGGATLGFAGTQTLSGGEVVFENTTALSTLGLAGAGTLTLAASVTVRGGLGTIGPAAFGTVSGTIVNQGLISADSTGQTLTVNAAGAFTNSGTVQAAASATLSLSGSITNYADQTLTGGTWRVQSGGVLSFGPGLIHTNAATIELVGTGAFAALSSLALNNGSLTLADGRAFDFAPANNTFTNAATGTITKSGTGSTTIPSALTLDSPGTIVAASGTLTISAFLVQYTGASLTGGTWKALSGGVLVLPGLVTTNAAAIYLSGTGSIPSAAGLATNAGTLTFADGYVFNFLPAGGVFVNAAGGTIAKAGSGQTVIHPGVILNNLGTVLVSQGTLTLECPISQVNGSTLTGGSWRVDGGTLEMDSQITSSAALITIGGAGAAFPAITGLVSNSGTMTVSSGGALTLGPLTSSGTLVLNPGGLLTVTGALNNTGAVTLAGGTLAALGGGASSGSFAFTAAAGTLIFAGDHALSAAATFTGSAGSIIIAEGTSTWAAPLSTALSFSIRGGTLILSAAATLTGKVVIAAGELRFNAGASVAGARLDGGTLSGSADITITSSMAWTGGAMTGAGRLVIPAAATLTIAGATSKTLSRALSNSGTINWTAGSISIDGGSIANQTGANFNASADGAITATGVGGSITNAGTLTKSATAISTIATRLDNAGLVRVQAGELRLSGGGMHTGDFTVAAGTLTLGGDHQCAAGADITGAGAFNLARGTLTTAGAFSLTGNAVFQGVAALNGSLAAGAISILGGSLAISADSTAASVYNAGTLALGAHKLTLSGAYAQAASATLSLRIDDLAMSHYGRIVASGAVSIAGALQIAWAEGYVPGDGDTFNLLTGSTRSGQFATTSVQSLGSNRAFVFSYTPTGVRLTVRARIFDPG